ncbi:probable L-type lectin-domain containing receptor kinase S.5 [Phragmites australis]|uniref:probable L-type lectin-domain containing receptor kinase S.5 n=1 Tax=Phragmites australis TaxID=29695 RepID=UPI002D764B6C|nr:probable L-type lectin-domain containing receptor kinase S.5 [Phragmites australis]
MAVRFLVSLLLLGAAASSSSTSLATNSTAAPGVGGDNVTTFSFTGFYSAFRGANVTVLGDANIDQGALQITPDSLNDAATYLTNKSGRVLYANAFRLWDGKDNATGYKKVASFSTVFTVNVFRPIGTEPAEGFAFVIAPNADEPPAGSYGGYLGLTNAATDGNATNQIVAVELDTEKQPYDPDDNHVGLNVNSVVSVANTSLKPLGIEISPVDAVKYNVWIDYDGVARRIAVYMAVAGKAKPGREVLAAPLDLGETVAERSYFGFSASTGRKYQLNCVLAWNMTVEKLPFDDDKGKKSLVLGLAIGVPVGLLALVAAAILAYVYVVKRRKMHGDDGSAITGTMIRSLAGGPREFEYRELRKATNNFDEKMKLGQGGYGVVYRGVVVGDHTSPGGAGSTVEVAVKKFSRASTQGQNDFLAELCIINRLRHKHLVRLVGWSHDNGELLLVYEFMPNGSLDQHLFSSAPGRPLLGWELRYNIVKGVASALHYLHDEYDQRVVHRDLKASNIMLDAAFSARLGDFGLARAIETDKTSYMEEVGGGVHGTVGYIAPECFHTEKATRESDVYAFGAVVLEVVCGRRPRCDIDGFHFLVDWVWRLHRDGRALEAVDPRLEGAFDRDQAEGLLLLGLACSHPTPAERPKTPAIQQILLGSVPPPAVPPFKPSFVWPATDGGLDTMTTTAGTSSSQLSLTSASTWSGNFMRGSLSHALQQSASDSLP